jgi:outer membrane receptor protein involved in Fe transport
VLDGSGQPDPRPGEVLDRAPRRTQQGVSGLGDRCEHDLGSFGASLLYGNNALGGVVNVISGDIPTAVPGHREGYVATQGETVNPGGALSAGLVLPAGKRFAVGGRLSGRSLDDVRAGGNVRQIGTYSRNQGAVVGAA